MILALDQGTTSSRAILFGRDGKPIAIQQQEFPQLTPSSGHVEHDPEAIWTSQLQVARDVLKIAAVDVNDLTAVGIANQRETTVVWERDSGRPVANAIVWQSRISADICEQLKEAGHEELFRQRTGLVLDPYFSGTKLKYILDRYNLHARAKRGELLFGTIDTYLIWRLTCGKVHATDVSNASRTLMFDIHQLDWNDELLQKLDVPRKMLPTVGASSGSFGSVDAQWLGEEIPITGVAGDQQAATFGQACFAKGSAKNTYGTGCFLMMNTGTEAVESKHQLLTTIGWQLGDEVTYCLEGSVFVAGAVVQWLRDGLGLIQSSDEVEQLSAEVDDDGGVVVVPAFVGLGAPYWDPYARGGIFGLSRGTERGHLARAAVDSMAYQTRDLVEAMQQDAGLSLERLRVDGGAAVNNRLMQFQADLLGTSIDRPTVFETTALGAAYLAGLAVGYWKDLDDVTSNWVRGREFVPQGNQRDFDPMYNRWLEAVSRTRNWSRHSTQEDL